MRGLGYLKEFAEQTMESKESRVRVEKLAQDIEKETAQDEKAKMRAIYAEFLVNCPIEKKVIMYESFGGRGMICNPYAIFKYLMTQKEYQKYRHIWVIDDFQDNEAVMEEYKNDENVSFVKYQSEEYLRALATSKYLINNVSFPGFFVKRKGQIYLNTWHGSPMKTMGFDIPGGNISSGNSAKNLLSADYILSQSPYMTERAWLGSYKMRNIYNGLILENGFPRNDVFFHSDREAIIKKLQKHGINMDGSKKTILYAPTWKGEKYSSPKTSLEAYYKVIEVIEKHIDTETYQVLVKPHQIVYYHIKNSGGTTAQFLPAILDTNEILSVVDVLISDYSSIHFDFLATEKPIVFFLPDFDDFKGYRGLYFEPEKLGGPIVTSYEALGECFEDIEKAVEPYKDKYREEKAWACPRDDGNVCRKVVETMFGGKHTGIEVRCSAEHKKKLLLYAGDFQKNDITNRFFSFLNGIDYNKIDVTVLVEEGAGNSNTMVDKIPHEVRVLYWKPHFTVTSQEYARHRLADQNKVCPPYDFYRREIKRAVGDCTFDVAAALVETSSEASSIYKKMIENMKSVTVLSEELQKLKTPVNLRRIHEEEASQTSICIDGKEYMVAELKNCKGNVELETMEYPDKSYINIVSCGTFQLENHYGELIRTFDKLYKERGDVRLHLLGDGPQREMAEKLCKEHHLSEIVYFHGELKYPLTFMKHCQYFVLESKAGEQAADVLSARALGLTAIVKYSELSMTLKGKYNKSEFVPEAYNEEIKRELERLLEV